MRERGEGGGGEEGGGAGGERKTLVCACVCEHTHILRHIHTKTTDLKRIEGVAEKCDPETVCVLVT